jgi:hypothetical protein
VLTAILSLLGVRDQLEARRAARLLRKPAADCIQALAIYGCQPLPEHAWQRVFEAATQLVVAARLEGTRPEALVASMPRLLAGLPRQLRKLHVRVAHHALSVAQSTELAAALAAAPCSGSLLELQWALPLRSSGVDLLLGALGSLQVRCWPQPGGAAPRACAAGRRWRPGCAGPPWACHHHRRHLRRPLPAGPRPDLQERCAQPAAAPQAALPALAQEPAPAGRLVPARPRRPA